MLQVRTPQKQNRLRSQNKQSIFIYPITSIFRRILPPCAPHFSIIIEIFAHPPSANFPRYTRPFHLIQAGISRLRIEIVFQTLTSENNEEHK